MTSFIEASNIVELHKKIKQNVNVKNIFSSDEESVKYLIKVMNDIYSEKAFINNLQILNQNTLEEYINRLLPKEDEIEFEQNENENESEQNENEIESEPKINNYKIYINSNTFENNLKKNDYQFKLPYEYNNISKIELEYAKIPKSQYIITENNNKIYFQDTKKHVTENFFIVASIEEGNYNFEELAEEFQDAMNLIGNSKYKIFYNKIKNKFEFSSDFSHEDKTFNLKFNNDLLGFKVDYLYEGRKNYISENLINLNTNDNLDLIISNLNIKLGKFFLDCKQNQYFYYNKSKHEVIFNFNNPIEKLNTLDIKFLDSNNQIYNFNNFNHELIFNITTIN